MADALSRRDLLQRSAAGALVVLGAACGKNKAAPLACNDTTGLLPQDLTVRNLMKYVDVSPDPAKVCTNCQQFVPPPAPGSCGTCKVLKGTVNPIGSCISFAPKP
jgi:hypothetical protein